MRKAWQADERSWPTEANYRSTWKSYMCKQWYHLSKILTEKWQLLYGVSKSRWPQVHDGPKQPRWVYFMLEKEKCYVVQEEKAVGQEGHGAESDVWAGHLHLHIWQA